jgi:hypothetical protein
VTTRADVLREAAIVVAQSREAPTSNCYAIARELWALWMEEVGETMSRKEEPR